MREMIQQAIQQALDEAPERKFVETIEIAFTINDVDLKNPSNRIQEEIRLPNGRGKEISIAMFASGEMATKAKDAGVHVIDPTTIEDLGSNRQRARKIAKQHDFFLSEVPHMGNVGRYLGQVLGPRGKMPRPVPPVMDIAALSSGLRTTTAIRSRDKITFHGAVGSRSQSVEELTDNTMAVWTRVVGKLERGTNNLRSCYIKTSMGPSIKVEVVN